MALPLIRGEGEDERNGLKGGEKTEGPVGQDASCVPERLSGLGVQWLKVKVSDKSSGPFPPEK